MKVIYDFEGANEFYDPNYRSSLAGNVSSFSIFQTFNKNLGGGGHTLSDRSNNIAGIGGVTTAAKGNRNWSRKRARRKQYFCFCEI